METTNCLNTPFLYTVKPDNFPKPVALIVDDDLNAWENLGLQAALQGITNWEESGFVKIEQKDNKKYYSITDKGKEYLDSSWFPWRSASSFMNKDEGTSIDETIETLDNLSEFLAEKGKLLSKENKKTLRIIDDRLHGLLK